MDYPKLSNITDTFYFTDLEIYLGPSWTDRKLKSRTESEKFKNLSTD